MYGIPKLYITDKRILDANHIRETQEQVWQKLNEGQGLTLQDVMQMSHMNYTDCMKFVIGPLLEGDLIEVRSYYVKKV